MTDLRSPGARSPSGLSDRSLGSIGKVKTPDRPLSSASNASSTPSLRRVDGRSASGDLRAASRLGEARARTAKVPPPTNIDLPVATSSTYDPLKDKGKARAPDMTDVYEAWGAREGSPMSPTRPPSVRKRQSMHIMDLENRMDQLISENRSITEARIKAEQELQDANQGLEMTATTIRQ
ncbi:hypothetical protein LTS18_002464, partial [Coniosporium uncinatum]